MEKLAVQRGIFYEGDYHDLRAIHPTPVVSQASCGFITAYGTQEIVFREDSFDPVTRIRRGRFYVGGPDMKTWPIGRVDHGLYHPYQPYDKGAPGINWAAERAYDAWQPNSSPKDVSGQSVRLGGAGFETAWRVVGVERISTGHILFTLRAVSLVGVLPDLADELVNKDGVKVGAKPVHDALESLVDALHKQQATPIVDVARETAKVILTAWIGSNAQGKDLGDVIKAMPKGKDLAVWATSIVNRLHPRGKSAERESQEARGAILREVLTEDAETSVHLIGLLLREVGWAAESVV